MPSTRASNLTQDLLSVMSAGAKLKQTATIANKTVFNQLTQSLESNKSKQIAESNLRRASFVTSAEFAEESANFNDKAEIDRSSFPDVSDEEFESSKNRLNNIQMAHKASLENSRANLLNKEVYSSSANRISNAGVNQSINDVNDLLSKGIITAEQKNSIIKKTSQAVSEGILLHYNVNYEAMIKASIQGGKFNGEAFDDYVNNVILANDTIHGYKSTKKLDKDGNEVLDKDGNTVYNPPEVYFKDGVPVYSEDSDNPLTFGSDEKFTIENAINKVRASIQGGLKKTSISLRNFSDKVSIEVGNSEKGVYSRETNTSLNAELEYLKTQPLSDAQRGTLKSLQRDIDYNIAGFDLVSEMVTNGNHAKLTNKNYKHSITAGDGTKKILSFSQITGYLENIASTTFKALSDNKLTDEQRVEGYNQLVTLQESGVKVDGLTSNFRSSVFTMNNLSDLETSLGLVNHSANLNGPDGYRNAGLDVQTYETIRNTITRGKEDMKKDKSIVTEQTILDKVKNIVKANNSSKNNPQRFKTWKSQFIGNTDAVYAHLNLGKIGTDIDIRDTVTMDDILSTAFDSELSLDETMSEIADKNKQGRFKALIESNYTNNWIMDDDRKFIFGTSDLFDNSNQKQNIINKVAAILQLNKGVDNIDPEEVTIRAVHAMKKDSGEHKSKDTLRVFYRGVEQKGIDPKKLLSHNFVSDTDGDESHDVKYYLDSMNFDNDAVYYEQKSGNK